MAVSGPLASTVSGVALGGRGAGPVPVGPWRGSGTGGSGGLVGRGGGGGGRIGGGAVDTQQAGRKGQRRGGEHGRVPIHGTSVRGPASWTAGPGDLDRPSNRYPGPPAATSVEACRMSSPISSGAVAAGGPCSPTAGSRPGSCSRPTCRWIRTHVQVAGLLGDAAGSRHWARSTAVTWQRRGSAGLPVVIGTPDVPGECPPKQGRAGWGGGRDPPQPRGRRLSPFAAPGGRRTTGVDRRCPGSGRGRLPTRRGAGRRQRRPTITAPRPMRWPGPAPTSCTRRPSPRSVRAIGAAKGDGGHRPAVRGVVRRRRGGDGAGRDAVGRGNPGGGRRHRSGVLLAVLRAPEGGGAGVGRRGHQPGQRRSRRTGRRCHRPTWWPWTIRRPTRRRCSPE